MYRVIYKGFNGNFSMSDEMSLEKAHEYKQKLLMHIIQSFISFRLQNNLKVRKIIMTNEEFVKLYNMKLQELKEECEEQVKDEILWTMPDPV